MMNTTGFIEVLTAGLVPYLHEVDTNPMFMQDNDPKHTSRRVGLWLDEKNINWWKTPAESPDLNPHCKSRLTQIVITTNCHSDNALLKQQFFVVLTYSLLNFQKI